MAGQGKYTTYVPGAAAKYALLGRLFKGNSTITSPFAAHMESGNQEAARLETIARGEELLRPTIQQGDLDHFPQGVNLNYDGVVSGISSPHLPDVKWENAGDPANPYMPDLTSPGPGRTDPQALDTDPEISVADIEGEAYIPGAPGTTTRSPSITKGPIREANTLGEALGLGKSSNNEPSGF